MSIEENLCLFVISLYISNHLHNLSQSVIIKMNICLSQYFFAVAQDLCDRMEIYSPVKQKSGASMPHDMSIRSLGFCICISKDTRYRILDILRGGAFAGRCGDDKITLR